MYKDFQVNMVPKEKDERPCKMDIPAVVQVVSVDTEKKSKSQIGYWAVLLACQKANVNPANYTNAAGITDLAEAREARKPARGKDA